MKLCAHKILRQHVMDLFSCVDVNHEKQPPYVFIKKAVLKKENTCIGMTCNFIKKRLQHGYFPVNITKFLRTPILKNTCEGLLLNQF